MTEPKNNVVRELTENELTIVGGGLTWGNLVKVAIIVSAAIAIGGLEAGAMVASDMLGR